jgi:hypothetical protein
MFRTMNNLALNDVYRPKIERLDEYELHIKPCFFTMPTKRKGGEMWVISSIIHEKTANQKAFDGKIRNSFMVTDGTKIVGYLVPKIYYNLKDFYL